MSRVTLTRKDNGRPEDVVLNLRTLTIGEINVLAKRYSDFFNKVKVDLF